MNFFFKPALEIIYALIYTIPHIFSIEDQYAKITEKYGLPKPPEVMGPPKGFQSLMDMHPGLKKPQTVINKASSDRLSKPKEGVKPVKKNKNPLDSLLDDDGPAMSSGYDTYDSTAIQTAINGTPGMKS